MHMDHILPRVVLNKQGIRHFLPEVDGRHFILFTDHHPLLGAFKSPNNQTHDSIAFNQLTEISMRKNDIRFISGKCNLMADFLSRPPDVPLEAAYAMPEPEHSLEGGKWQACKKCH